MSRLSTRSEMLGLACWLAASFAAAALGGFASAGAGDFYGALTRPVWAPPAWLFAPVWTVLYALMGISAWLVWRRHGLENAAPALGLFVVQLVVNALWTWLFFVWHLGVLALAEIVLLWLLILATAIAFNRLDRIAGALLFPYLVWVSFAAALTLSLWRLNPAVLG